VSQYRTYNFNDAVVFHKTREQWGGLSNMAANFSVKVNDVIIPTIEHLYQACRFPYHSQVQLAIICEPSPMTAKMISRKNLQQTRKDWDLVRFKIMRWCLEIKLSQNWESFSGLLRQTGDKPIVELAPKDKIWGAVREGNTLHGINALGRLLMDVRECYVKTNDYQRCIQPLSIPDFKLFDNPINLVCNDADWEEIEWSLQYAEECWA
jgi:ribA/ribD-fused uncharacterized protein